MKPPKRAAARPVVSVSESRESQERFAASENGPAIGPRQLRAACLKVWLELSSWLNGASAAPSWNSRRVRAPGAPSWSSADRSARDRRASRPNE